MLDPDTLAIHLVVFSRLPDAKCGWRAGVGEGLERAHLICILI